MTPETTADTPVDAAPVETAPVETVETSIDTTPSKSMKPVAVVFTLANAAVFAMFVAMVALGHVRTNLPGVDLGITATAAPTGR